MMLQTIILSTLFLSSLNKCASKPTHAIAVVNPNDNEIDVDKEIEYRIDYAKQMLSFMNQSIDPCDDFYEYSCGNWKNIIGQRYGDDKRSNLNDIEYKIVDIVKEFLETPAEEFKFGYKTELKIAQQFYKSCLQAHLYPVQKSQEYLNIINHIGGFPAVNASWNPDKFDWFNMSAHLTNYNVGSLVKEEILPEYPFPPYFKMPELGFDSYVHSDNIASNTTHVYALNDKRMRQYLTLYGVEEPKLSEVVSDVFDFLRAVVNVTDQFDEDQRKCSEMSDDQKFLRWNNYFDITWKKMPSDFMHLNVSECPCDYFYVELDKICNAHKEAVANYLAMKFLYHLDAKLKDSKFQSEYCVITVRSAFPLLFTELYLTTHFNMKIREEISIVIKELRKSLHESLAQAEWLDEQTREQALLKESTMLTRIGYVEDANITARIIGEINNLEFVADNFERNMINMYKFRTYIKRYYDLHTDTVDNHTKPLELLNAIRVNAFYYNIDNSIVVNAGILHPPVYHNAWPNSLKFGTLGFILGHEFTHGFDTVGAHFDSTGADNHWWTRKSADEFEDRAGCYVMHYNNYTVPEINRQINGFETRDENIADGGGLREAFNAYRRYTKEISKETANSKTAEKREDMPGLKFSPEQLFFLGFAQLWCSAYKEEHYWNELNEYHTMDKYRVLGAVTNFEEFANVYECPVGSNMNPKKNKCKIW